VTSVILRDGRRLGFDSWGDPGGPPLLYLHGAAGSPVEGCEALLRAVGRLGMRFVMVSRPGFGVSDPHPGRTILDHADDIGQLADALGLDRFGVLGCSAGGPYALACAALLGDRVAAVTLSSTTVPMRGRDVAVCRGASERLVRWATGCRPLLGGMAWTGLRATGRTTSPSAIVDDVVLAFRPWGFPLAAVRADVHLFHGARDTTVPVRMALDLARALPRGRATVLPDAGHFFLRRRVDGVLDDLAVRYAGVASRRSASTDAVMPIANDTSTSASDATGERWTTSSSRIFRPTSPSTTASVSSR
jgi:pimeloyl-ACP methyl ester carboxylesterase